MKHLFVIQQFSYFIKLGKAKKNGLKEANAPCHKCLGPNRVIPTELGTDTALSESQANSSFPSQSMFKLYVSSKVYHKILVRKWRANIGRFLFLLWNLTWNLKVKSKYMPLSFWRFPRLIFLLFCNKWLVQSFMWMQNNHDNEQTVDWSQKWEAEWNPNDTRTATVKAESKMNLIHLIPNLIFTYIWLQHLRQYYHYICC